MGSTIEAAIAISLVLVIITALILGPEDVCIRACEDLNCGMAEIEFEMNDSEVASFREIGGVTVSDASPERLCTFLSGLSDNFRLIFGGVMAVAGGD